ncbi:MAG: hypothetical protein J6Q69_03860 [Clostridia bacterium]|nr:hypothetical protein [Clostridia bacterium]
MTVKELAARCGFDEITMPDPDREIVGAYIGDLLSWVMGRASADNAWITIMSNVNVVAVASLSDVSCVILAEGVTPEESVIMAAKSKGINMLRSAQPIYGVAKMLSDIPV